LSLENLLEEKKYLVSCRRIYIVSKNIGMAIEKIVVVDDELMIRKALETQLLNKKFSVAYKGNFRIEYR